MKNTKADKKRSDSERSLKSVKKQKTGKPKKPPTAYFVFLEEFREKYKRDNPNVKGVTAVVKACGAKWRSMSEQEKAPYVAKAAQKKAQYDDSVADYNKKQEAGDGSGEKSDSGAEQSGDEEED
ncbi:unnamed protein product [Victoria cruziana]